MATTSRMSCKNKAPPSRTYSYTPLKDVKVGTSVDVYGVVKFFKLPMKTRRGDYMMLLSITDPSLGNHSDAKLKCNLFFKDEGQVPQVKKVGDIVRMHRLKISSFNDENQGQTGPGFSCLVFEGDPGSSMEPRTANKTYVMSEDDKKKVQELRSWLSQDGTSVLDQGGTRKMLSQCKMGDYFNLLCQVVSINILEIGTTVNLKVWDGTKCESPFLQHTPTDTFEETDPELKKRAKNYLVDIFVFDDHFDAGESVKPGQVIFLQNLHAMEHKDDQTDQNTDKLIEFCLHKGTSYGRGIKKVQGPEAEKLKEELAKIPADIDNSEESNGESREITDDDKEWSDAWENLENNSELQSTQNRKEERNIEKSQTCKRPAADTAQGQNSNQPGISSAKKMKESENEISESNIIEQSKDNENENTNSDINLLPEKDPKKKIIISEASRTDFTQNEKTAINQTENAHIFTHDEAQEIINNAKFGGNVDKASALICKCSAPISTIRDVIEHDTPYKFRVLAQVVSYKPRTNIVKVYCEKCDFDATLEDEQVKNAKLLNTSNDVPLYSCPKCPQSPSNVLQYTYKFILLLMDKTGWLVAYLCKKQADQFFDPLSAQNAMHNVKDSERISTWFSHSCPNPGEYKDSDNKHLECCIASYNANGKKCFQIFDTKALGM